MSSNGVSPTATGFQAEDNWTELTGIHNSGALGNHVVATQPIQEGQLILLESPVVSSACATVSPCKPIWKGVESSSCLPLCLACGKKLEISMLCTRCKWPVCNEFCQDDPTHAEAECSALARHSVLPEDLTLSDYAAINVLRALFLRKIDPVLWQKLQDLESHPENRKLSTTDREEFMHIKCFIQQRCGLYEFASKTIDKVMGALTVNAYWAYPELGRYMSLVFDKASLFAHECEPNTRREIVEQDVIQNGVLRKVMAIKVYASRMILPGEMITISYIPNTHKLVTFRERNKYLNTYFYFTCQCKCCSEERANAAAENGANNPGMNGDVDGINGSIAGINGNVAHIQDIIAEINENNIYFNRNKIYVNGNDKA